MRIRLCLIVLACAVAGALTGTLRAQSIVFQQSVSQGNIVSHSQTMGRDFWIAPSSVLFVGANAPGTAYVQFPGMPVQVIAVSPTGPVTVPIPTAFAITTSDTIQHRYVHIWSTSVDLAVSSFLLSGPYYDFSRTQDGTNMLPVTAWDTDYVIAAGAPTFRSTSFTIAAANDSSIVTITPSCDIARNGKIRFYKRHVPFSIVLMRGQTVQFEQYQADTGVTGTTVHSSKPVGIVARTTYSTSYTTAPAPSLEAMLPMRSWGTVYYTPPYGRISLLFIASQDSQVIRRFDRDPYTGLKNYVTIPKKNQGVWLDLVDTGSRWESDAPFLATLYTSSYGFPSVTLQPRQQYTKRLSFYAIPGHGMTYSVFVSRKATFATMDGVSIMQWPLTHIDSFYDCYTNVVWPTGTSHGFESDQPLTAFAVSSSYQSSFALGAANGVVGAEIGDTISPTVTFDTTHYCAFVHVADHDSKLTAIIADSISNFSVVWDTSAHSKKDSTVKELTDVYSLQSDSTGVRICLIDSLSTASYGFTALDLAGNSTRYTISYVPNPRFFHPGFVATTQGLDSCLENQFEDFTIETVDTSLMRVEIDNVWTDSPYFIFDRTTLSDNALPFNLLPSQPHKFHFRFAPTESKTYYANAYMHSYFAGTLQVPLVGIGYPWVVGPVEAVTAEGSEAVRCFPNPATSLIHVTSSGASETSLELFNVLGQQVLLERWQDAETRAVSLLQIPGGVYTYRIRSGRSFRTGKLLIEKQ